MSIDNLQTLREYIEDFDDESYVNISFDGESWYHFKVKNVKEKKRYETMLSYLVIGINKTYITIASKAKIEKSFYNII